MCKWYHYDLLISLLDWDFSKSSNSQTLRLESSLIEPIKYNVLKSQIDKSILHYNEVPRSSLQTHRRLPTPYAKFSKEYPSLYCNLSCFSTPRLRCFSIPKMYRLNQNEQKYAIHCFNPWNSLILDMWLLESEKSSI